MLSTHYDHHEVEKGKYENWKNKGYFLSGDLTKTKFNYVGYSRKFVFLKYALIISLITLILFLKFIKKKQLKNLLAILLNLNIFALIIYIFVGTKIYDLYSLINIMSILIN